MTECVDNKLNPDTLKKRKLKARAERPRALVVVETPDRVLRHQRFALEGTDCSFGRIGTRVVVDDPRLSKAHFNVSATDDAGYRVVDLDTTNGTFVDGRRVHGSCALPEHAVISAGDTLIVLDVDPPLHDLPAAPSTMGDVPCTIVGSSRCAVRLRRSLETVAEGADPVLLLGETGVGKEVAAQAIHELSGRTGRWIAVNCAAIPRELADSILFGHDKGAFTGADEATQGFFARADGGTLFLDEIGELPTAVQAKLLRVLETGVVERVGGETQRVDVRVISATHQPVIDTEDFRADLYARLSDWVVRIPPLRERRVDILQLFAHFASQESDGEVVTFTPEFAEALLVFAWPHNVRELKKLAKRAVKLRSGDEELDLLALPPHIADGVLNRGGDGPPPATALTNPDDRVSDAAPTRQEMLSLIERARGNVQAIARENQWHRMQVYRWVKRYGIDPADYR